VLPASSGAGAHSNDFPEPHPSERAVPRAFVFALLAAFLTASPATTRAAELGYPRLANMYWPVAVDSAIVANLAKWDVVVVNSVWTDAQLAQLRALNPDIRIYFYVIAYTVELPPASGDAWKMQNYNYAAANDLWWYDKNLGVASDWPNTQMCNITSVGPSGPQGSYRQYFAASIAQMVASHPDLDGIFLDNFWQQLSWQQSQRQLDSDCNPTHNPAGCNGVADSNQYLDSLWNAALRDIAADIRGRFDLMQVNRPRPLAILTNNATDYFESLNGAMVEYFPSGHSNVDYDNPYGYNWNQEMLTCPGGYLVAPFDSSPYSFGVLNGDYVGSLWTPARNPEFERLKRFTLVSALLGDGYYSLDAGAATGHGNLWWEAEYDHAGRGKGYLGQPLGPMVRLLQPTGAEMIQNGGFDNGIANWDWYGFGGAVGTFSADAATFHSAPAAGRVVISSLPAGGEYKLWQSPLFVTQHQPYTLSFWARASVPQQISMHIYSEGCPGFRCWNDRSFCISTNWQRYEISFTSNSTAPAGLNIFIRTPGTFWMDDVSLRPGDTSLFRRDFEHGAVLLNYTNTTRTVDLGGNFWRLRIPGSMIFDGGPTTAETIPVSDARIVMRDSIPPLPRDSTVSDAPPAAGTRNALFQNDPNPFNPTTVVEFSLERSEHVSLMIFDVAGRRVTTLVDAVMPAGPQRALWDGRDARGRILPSGVYFYRLRTPTFAQTRKMTLLR
jgi:hypothetical protein